MNAFYLRESLEDLADDLRETLAASLVLVAFAGVVLCAMRGCS